jgi:hypothetical protein
LLWGRWPEVRTNRDAPLNSEPVSVHPPFASYPGQHRYEPTEERRAALDAPLFECNYLIGGKPGQGKSNPTRVLARGAAFDPTAQIWAFTGVGESSEVAPFTPTQGEGVVRP